ncbi:hypothetical protein M8J77_005970 [Diaphorina citri]|nr:hypothetical protein M8J77_005970 [Diaphorina citri]
MLDYQAWKSFGIRWIVLGLIWCQLAEGAGPGFGTGKGTREAILALRLIAEESMRVNQPLFIAFVDLQKAFDNVNWSLMMKILKDIGVEYRDRRIIFNLYRNQSMHIEINQESEKAKIKKGVRQGCNISPYLFNIYIEKAIEECKECCTGIVLNGVRIQMLRFADDIALLAPDEFNLKRSLECMNEVLAEYKMKMNMTKIEILVSKREAETVNIRVNGCELKQSKSFKYLGSNITENAKSVVDIKQRIAQAKAAFMKKSETWVIGMAERKEIEAFEMWCWAGLEDLTSDHLFGILEPRIKDVILSKHLDPAELSPVTFDYPVLPTIFLYNGNLTGLSLFRNESVRSTWDPMVRIVNMDLQLIFPELRVKMMKKKEKKKKEEEEEEEEQTKEEEKKKKKEEEKEEEVKKKKKKKKKKRKN